MSNIEPATRPAKESKPENKRGLTSVAFYSTNIADAMAVLRLLDPAAVAGIDVVRGTREIAAVEGNPIKDCDEIVIQRDFSRDYDTTQKIMSLARWQRKPVVVDLDDLLLALPKDHPDRLSGFFSNALLPMLQTLMEADLVTVATEPLREFLIPYNSNIKVIPNYFDDKVWKLSPWRSQRQPGDHVTIGYMGGHSHAPDLAMVLPALMQLVEKYSGRISFSFWGVEPPEQLKLFSRTNWFPPPTPQYADFAANFQNQTADIFIAPLCDNLFNSCKSPIKFFDYSAIGAPVVCSRVKPYENILEDGKDGLLATSTDEWVEEVSRLIESPELGNQLVEHAQRKIYDHWRLSQNAHKQFEVYQSEMNNYGATAKSDPVFLSLIKTITAQSHEKWQLDEAALQKSQSRGRELEMAVERLDFLDRSLEADLTTKSELIESLEVVLKEQRLAEEKLRENITKIEDHAARQTAQIDELRKVITDLEEEVLEYSSSKSWRWTRPFRQMLSRLRR